MSLIKLKKILYISMAAFLVPLGYLVGLASNPHHVQAMEVVQKEIIPLHTALRVPTHLDKNREVSSANPLPQVKYQKQPSSQYVTQNPFTSSNIINVPDNQPKSLQPDSLKNDPRFTVISTDNYDNNQEIAELSIEIPGLKPLEKAKPAENKKQTQTLSMKHNEDLFSLQRIPLAPSPFEGYYAKSAQGTLPVQPLNQAPLYKIYGGKIKRDKTKKPIGIIMGGLGMNRDLTMEAIKTLPPAITLGFIPYSQNLQSYIDMAREYGHEVILELPLEPFDYPRQDVGEHVLLSRYDIKTTRQKLFWHLSRATGYSGVMNYLGGGYFSKGRNGNLLQEIKQKGLYFIENPTLKPAMLKENAYKIGAYYGASRQIIDKELTPAAINKALTIAQKSAETNNNIIVTAYLSKLSLRALRKKSLHFPIDNIQIIPISDIITP